MLKPTTNPLRDAGWRVNKRKRQSKAGNNWTSTFNRATRQHGRHVYYSNPQLYKTIKAIHGFTITVKKHKQGTMQIYNRIMQFTRQHLNNTTSQDWRHPHTFTRNPKRKGSRDFPERVVESSFARPLLRVPPAWSTGSCRASARVARSTARTGFWGNGRVFRR